MFQTAQGSSWLIDQYAHTAQHPSGASLYDDLFKLKLIPSTTDFVVIDKYGGIPGLDMAWGENGYVYHTLLDDVDQIIPGSVQYGMLLFSLT